MSGIWFQNKWYLAFYNPHKVYWESNKNTSCEKVYLNQFCFSFDCNTHHNTLQRIQLNFWQVALYMLNFGMHILPWMDLITSVFSLYLEYWSKAPFVKFSTSVTKRLNQNFPQFRPHTSSVYLNKEPRQTVLFTLIFTFLKWNYRTVCRFVYNNAKYE